MVKKGDRKVQVIEEEPEGEGAEEDEFDSIFKVLSNPTRRRILEKLTKEPHYPLQLSRELRLSQQVITKHLSMLERTGMIGSLSVPSRTGPPRRVFQAMRSFSISVFMGPNLFETRVRSLGVDKPEEEGTDIKEEQDQRSEAPVDSIEEFHDRYLEILHLQNYKEKVRGLAELTDEINAELDDIGERRIKLLRIKEAAVKEANSIIEELYNDYYERNILYHLLDDMDTPIPLMSRDFAIRERMVRNMIRRLLKDDIMRRE